MLIEELLNVNFDKYCRDCPYNTKDFSKRFYEYVDSIDIDTVIANPDIANDIDLLQKHYTILLDFCYELMEKDEKKKEEIEILKRKLNWYERKKTKWNT